nr:glycosyltransferase [uncultured Chitinophaga sp.]
MKVLHITKYFYPLFGGVERIAEQISDAISASGHTEVRFAYKSYKEKTTVEHNRENETILKPFFYWKSQPISFVKATIRLFSKYRAADTVIVHSPFPNFELALLLFSPFVKRRIICVLHAEPADTRWKSVASGLQFFYRNFLRICDVVVFTNEYNARKCTIPHKNGIVINNAVKIRKTIVREFRQKEVHDVLFVGSFREYKGLRFLIDVLKNKKDVHLHLVGSGELLVHLKDYVANNGYDGNVTFYGNVSDQELEEVYEIADVFVLPSIDGSEAFGLVQVEAMAHGLPVINTDLETAVKYVSLHEVSGLTVPPCDSDAIAGALDKILQPAQYNTYSRNAVERARIFSSENMVKQYMTLLDGQSNDR